ncbi:MAG: helix-turn-helix transcriptional regulator [Clostridia bacterium]|nr:helix-turn-helix transcriptional regulator [Clostridia bacterium]
MESSNKNTQKSSYFVKQAGFLKVGKEWNANDWNARHNPTGYHVLYYRTDTNPTKAVLHMIDGDMTLEPGKVYFVPAFSVLKSEIDGEIEKYYIHFESDSIEFGLYRQLFERCHVPETPLTKELFDIILKNFDKNTVAAERRVSGAMDILMADFLENSAVLPRDTERFRPVIEYIEQNYRMKIPVSDLAKIMNVSTVYFSSIFKSAFHVSPKQYILGKRLFESQLLLIGTNMSIREIAEKIGFENENYFSELFSAKVGISALQFRKNARI